MGPDREADDGGEILRLKDASAPRMETRRGMLRDRTCYHYHVVIDDQNRAVECADCGATLDPIAVLARHAGEETRLVESIRTSRIMLKALDDKRNFKCDHCGKLSNVERRVVSQLPKDPMGRLADEGGPRGA